MTEQELMAKLAELRENQDFIEKAKNSKNLDELAELFNAEGLSVDAEDLEKLSGELLSDENNELAEEDLENVAGGGIVIAVWKVASVIIGWSWKNTPGKTDQEKIQYIYDFWKNAGGKLKKKLNKILR